MMFTYFQIAYVKHNILKQENRLKKVEKLHNTLYTCHVRMINIHLIYRLQVPDKAVNASDKINRSNIHTNDTISL